MPPLDVLVLGKGPAGLTAAAALAERGLGVGVLGPAGPVHWPAQYGAWAEELSTVGYPDLIEHRWSQTVIGLGEGRRRILPHAYARVDKHRLAEALLARCEQGGVRWLDGRARDVEHGRTGSLVRCGEGTQIRATMVVDATGHRPALLHPNGIPLQGFQTAFGMTFEVEEVPFAPGQAILMDWDHSHLPDSGGAAAPPTFLYAMPLGGGLVFAEETALVSRPAVPLPVLEQRLHRRLEALGIRPGRIVERERCWIPMGGPLPEPEQTVGFGGAAGMVHPATGYLLTATLGAAPRVADAITRVLGASDADPARAAEAAWGAIWPADRRRRRELYRFGMEVLLRLDAATMPAFFDTFFDLPDHEWQGYLNDRLSAAALATAMRRLFVRVPDPVRAVMVRSALGTSGARLGLGLLRTWAA